MNQSRGHAAYGEVTTSVNDCWAESPLASVTCTLNVAVPAAVGVPLIVPLAAPKVSPDGRAPETMDHAQGEVAFVTCKVWL